MNNEYVIHHCYTLGVLSLLWLATRWMYYHCCDWLHTGCTIIAGCTVIVVIGYRLDVLSLLWLAARWMYYHCCDWLQAGCSIIAVTGYTLDVVSLLWLTTRWMYYHCCDCLHAGCTIIDVIGYTLDVLSLLLLATYWMYYHCCDWLHAGCTIIAVIGYMLDVLSLLWLATPGMYYHCCDWLHSGCTIIAVIGYSTVSEQFQYFHSLLQLFSPFINSFPCQTHFLSHFVSLFFIDMFCLLLEFFYHFVGLEYWFRSAYFCPQIWVWFCDQFVLQCWFWPACLVMARSKIDIMIAKR